MKTFKLKISTPSGEVFNDSAAKLDVRGIEGEIAIMAGHIPFITALKSGHCDIMLEDGSERHAELGGGILNVAQDSVILLTGIFRWI
jgi:F0F1-type ATP synthase epsilon subunit